MVVMPRSQLLSVINITTCTQHSKGKKEKYVILMLRINNTKCNLAGTTIDSKMESLNMMKVP